MHRYVIASILAFGLAGCASSPSPRYYAADGGPVRCANCGVVERIERVYGGESYASGGGAVLGAIIGGLLGNTIGKGDGRKAATIAGAVAGGVVGNEVEKTGNAGPYYEIFVALDDGRRVVVRQSDLGPLRDGARVILRGNRVERI